MDTKELFEIFGCNDFAKIRLLAIKIAREFGFNVSEFLNDLDGHVRNFASSAHK